MKKFFIIGFVFLLLSSVYSLLYAEEVTVTTYYPAPEGVYKDLQAENYYSYPLTQVPSEPVGTNYGVAPIDTSYLNNVIITGSLDLGNAEIIANKFTDSENYDNYYLDPANTDTSLIVAGDVIVAGNVGIGTTQPDGLQVNIRALQSTRGVDNVRLGIISGTPRLLLEDYVNAANDTLWQIDNWAGRFRIIDGGERFTIASNGNVGIGTTNPTDKLHVVGTGEAIKASDGAVSSRFFSASSTGKGYAGTLTNHPFVLRTVDQDRVTIDRVGNVGIGATSPLSRLDIQASGSGTVSRLLRNDGTAAINHNVWMGTDLVSIDFMDSTGFNSLLRLSSTGDSFFSSSNLALGYNSVPVGYRLAVNGRAGGTTGWVNYCDERLKKNIKTIENALDKVIKLRGVNFEWKDTKRYPSGLQMGLIAQEAKEVVPEVVGKFGEYYAMSTPDLTALLIEAIKEQQKEIEVFKTTNKNLEARLKVLEAKLNVKQ